MYPRLPLRLLCLGLFSLLLSTSHAQKKFDSALELNNYLASFTDTLYMGGREWGSEVARCIQTKNFSTLAAPRQKMELFCYRKYYELSKLTPQFGSQALINVMKEFLEFEINMINGKFLAFEQLNSSTSQSVIDKQIADLTQAGKEEGKVVKKINEQQQLFAKKNGFAIEAEKEED